MPEAVDSGISHRADKSEEHELYWKSEYQARIQEAVKEGKVTELAKKLAEERITLESQSMTDPLTGAFSRRYLQAALSREINLEVKKHGHKLAVIMIDIDDFKKVNDDQGHDVGDRVLIGLVKICNEKIAAAGAIGFTARYGGEEWAMVLAHQDHLGMVGVGTQVRAEIENYLASKASLAGKVTVSLGGYIVNLEDTPESALNKADQALLKAKKTGKNRMCVYNNQGKIE